MWQYKDNIIHINENLKNTIEKETSFRSNGSYIRINQVLSETALAFDVPCYLLDIWASYYRDASDILNKIVLIYNENEQSQTFYLNNKTFNDSSKKLDKQLKDFQVLFEYYLNSIRNFSTREKIRFKKSTLKNDESLKFIPVNLHLEQFLVETFQNLTFEPSNLNAKTCYDFTSVGAFTTVHSNKSFANKSLEVLMQNETRIDFFKEKSELIENEILLNFYALKLFIETLHQLADLKENVFFIKNEDKIKDEIGKLKSRIETLNDVIIKSYQYYVNQYAQSVRVENKQKFFDLTERLPYFKAKFQAFCIELINIISSKQFDVLYDLSIKITINVIDFYNTLIPNAMLDKYSFLDSCANLSQALTTLVSSINLKYYKNYNLTDQKLNDLLEFHKNNGMLFQIESMLSCSSNEYYMIYDHCQSIQNLNYVYVHLPNNNADLINQNDNFISLDLKSDGFHVHLYCSPENSSKPIKVYPIMVNVGINEQSVASSFFGNNIIQKFINTQSIQKICNYYAIAKEDLKHSQQTLETLLYNLKKNKSLIEDARPVELLQKMAELCRLMNGFRVTNCKSGKDRTGMSVSLEQCLILLRYHNLSNSMTQEVLNDLRRNGTRMDVVRKNVGQSRYAFNKIRYFLLPQLYRPPLELCDDLET